MTSGFGYRNILFNTNYGPYGTKYPSIVSVNNGILNGIRPTPAEFSIMETGNAYASARQTYVRASSSKNTISSGERIHFQKIINIGKSSLKQGLPVSAYISNKSCDKNYVASKLQRTRSSGCVAPKKCGSIYRQTIF
jgi:hypothetical protein